jgi:hypothetical protein
MHLHVLMTTALWPIDVKLQLPFVGRFCEGRLKAPLRDRYAPPSSHRKKETQLQTVKLGWRAGPKDRPRTIVIGESR